MNLKICIYGYGNFGKLISLIFKKEKIKHSIIDPFKNIGCELNLNEMDIVIAAVPVQYLEDIIRKIPLNVLIIDVASVKEYPKGLYEKYKKKAILTHPMFGPNSYKESGLEGKKLAVDFSLVSAEIRNRFLEAIELFKLVTIEISATEHDLITAKTLVLHHIFGRISPTLNDEYLDTVNYRKIKEVYDSVKSDSEELFKSLLQYNRYTGDILDEIETNLRQLRN